MSKETWEIVTSREIEEAELMLALQCAPLIAGLKVSNLLNIPTGYFPVIKRMLVGSDISWYVLLRSEERMSVLLYHEKSLKGYLDSSTVRGLLLENGYRNLELNHILREFCVRYEQYMVRKDFFPHEMGLLLGYPVEDVTGFIRNKGERALCTGYWKVQENEAFSKLRKCEREHDTAPFLRHEHGGYHPCLLREQGNRLFIIK
jgi:hypothetical protein